MTCWTYTYPLGATQTFSIAGLSLTLTASSFHYRPTGRNSLYEMWGYGRGFDPETVPKTKYGYLGASHWEAPPYAPAYLFQWALRNLNPTAFYTLEAIYKEHLRLRSPIRLLDGRIALMERTPRTRAKVGTVTGAPSIAGFTHFFPQFDIQIAEWGQPSRQGADRFSIEFSAREYDPDRPVPVTEDIP